MGSVIVVTLIAGMGATWVWARRRESSRPKNPLEERIQAELEVLNRGRRRW